MINYLTEFQKATNAKYTFAVDVQMRYYLSELLNSGQKERFPKLCDFINTIAQRHAQLNELQKFGHANNDEIMKNRYELCNEFIMGVYPTLKE